MRRVRNDGSIIAWVKDASLLCVIILLSPELEAALGVVEVLIVALVLVREDS
jgi:hypothetical protein